MKKKIKIGLLFLLVGGVVLSLIIWQRKPSHHRDWEVGQEKLPRIERVGDEIKISNFRNFFWKKDGTVEKNFEERKYLLSQLEGVDVIISHFSDFEGLAHIFLSFGFSSGERVVISMETRREKGEEFSPWRGLGREFEIIYVVGSEEDIIGLRTGVRNERVYIYPTIADEQKTQELFLKLAEDINRIAERPQFYNTWSNNCTNVITRRVEEISALDFPLTWKTFLPGYFDQVLFEMGLIPNSSGKVFEEIKNCHQVDNEKADYQNEDFSQQLRAGRELGF